MKTIKTLLICGLLAFSIMPCGAMQFFGPKMDAQSAVGIYEAISDNDVRLFRLEIRANRHAILIMAIDPGEKGFIFVYRSITCEIQDGIIGLKMTETDSGNSQDEITFHGTARGDAKAGRISGDLELKGRDDKQAAKWHLTFLKTEPSYIEILKGLSASARKKAKKLK
jgi:hypothetical protein